jgi:hypothetical protein
MAKLHPAHVGLAGSSAQLPDIRQRLGERVNSTILPFKIDAVNERKARESGPGGEAWGA